MQEMLSPCYGLGTNNSGITGMKVLQNSLIYGFSRNTIYAYIQFGTLLCSGIDIEKGYAFGRAALLLNEAHPDRNSESMLCTMWGGWAQHWKDSYADCKATLRKGIHIGIETGQYIWAFYNACNGHLNSLLRGENLHDIIEEAKQYQPVCRLDKFNAITWMIGAIADLAEELGTSERGAPGARQRAVDLDAIRAEARRANNMLYVYFANSFAVIGGVFRGAYEDVARLWGETEPSKLGMIAAYQTTPCYYFYGGVAFSRACMTAAPPEREAYLGKLRECARKVDTFAALGPQNLRHRSLTLRAELARIEQSEGAGALYDQAITAAREAQMLHDEALANELCARHYLELGRAFLARAYAAEAHKLYARWGARGVMERLERDFPQALHREAPRRREALGEGGGHADVELDAGAVIKHLRPSRARSSFHACSRSSCGSSSRARAPGRGS